MSKLKFVQTIAKDLMRRYSKHQLEHVSGSLAYFFTLSIFPLIIFIQALLGFFGVELSSLLETIQPIIPLNVYELLKAYVQTISGSNIGLLSFGLISALYSSSIALNSIMNAVLLAYNQSSHRKWYHTKALAILFTFLLGGSMSLFLIVPVLGSLIQPIIAMYLPDLLELFKLINRLSWLITAVAIVSTLALLYKIVPKKESKGSIWPGAIFASIGWLIGSTGFALLVNTFVTYSIYGVFGSIMIFLLWLYITGLMIILGAELNDSLDQHRRNKKSEAIES